MRLIDADKLKEHFSDEDNQCDLQTVIRNSIDLQPTAFDTDKVVKELEKRRKECEDISSNIVITDPYDFYYKGLMRGYEYSIDIVKRGE